MQAMHLTEFPIFPLIREMSQELELFQSSDTQSFDIFTLKREVV